jgi:hypothetical protein
MVQEARSILGSLNPSEHHLGFHRSSASLHMPMFYCLIRASPIAHTWWCGTPTRSVNPSFRMPGYSWPRRRARRSLQAAVR